MNALGVLALGAFAAIALGIADFFGARAAKDIGPVTAAFCVQVTGTVAFGVWYFLSGSAVTQMSTATWMYTLAGALFMGAGICTLYLAFDHGPVSLVSPLSAAFPLVTAAVGVVCFHAALSLGECAAVAVIVIGIMLASGLLGTDKGDRRIGPGPRLALLTTALWGVAYPLLGRAVEDAGWQTVTLIQLLTMVPALGAMLVLRRSQEAPAPRSVARCIRSPIVIGAGILQMLAVLAINVGYGLDQAAGTMVVTTSAAYPVITMLLALRYFDERADKVALAGAGLAVAGVLALHTF